MKDLLDLKIELKGEFGTTLKLTCEEGKTGNSVMFAHEYEQKGFSNAINRFIPKTIIYNTMSYYIVNYTKVYRLGTSELVEGEELTKIKEFIDDIKNILFQSRFIGILGLDEPKRI